MRRPEGKVRKEGLKLGRREIALGVGFAVFVLLVSIGVRASMQRSGEEPGAIADWCATGLEPLGDACFAPVPDAKALVLYLHGRYTPETEGEEKERQARVARMATARGFSVIAFRGKQGACLGPELATYFCWPSNEKTQDAGPETVAGWSAALDAAEKRVGKVPHYLLGFSNGAYFAALITTRALLPLEAVAIVSGGPVEPTKALGAKPPILLITADDDGAQDEMLRLESELAREHWPKTLASREGGHALTDFDVDMALKFFQRAPIVTRRPIRSADAAPTIATPPEDAGPATDPTTEDP